MFINCHSQYSLRYGALTINKIVDTAISNKIEYIALTDINSTSGIVTYIKYAKSKGLKPIIGVDFRNNSNQEFIAIARNNKGLHEINNLLSDILVNNKEVPERVNMSDNCIIIYPYEKAITHKLNDNEYIGIKPKDLNRFKFNKNNIPSENTVIHLSATFLNKTDHNIHRILRAIDNNTLLSRLPKTEEADENDILINPKDIISDYIDFPNIIKNTRNIFDSCQIDCSEFEYKRREPNLLNNDRDDHTKLRELVYKGLITRYKFLTKQITERTSKELNLIKEKGFSSYFLINWDIIRYAKSKGYYYVGRGSGANSIVAYSLGITNVDPIELDLYFERFINLYRSSPPDFDIDFSWKDRDDITRYIFNKYKHTALLATYVSFSVKSAIREIGKVFGLPKHEIDEISKNRKTSDPAKDRYRKLVIKYSKLLDGIPNQLSVHASGIIISKEPLQKVIATFKPPKGFHTTQFSMVEAEDIGYCKLDILSQRGLGHIRDTLELVKKTRGIDINVDDVESYKKDKRINDKINRGDTIGAFYIESPAMRMLLTKLNADGYNKLVAASSIIRPGVAKSGMMNEYIKRSLDKEYNSKKHNVLYSIMPDTYGIMVYQEDVIKVAHIFGGISLAEADVLRRIMSGKRDRENRLKDIKNQFFFNCKERGHNKRLTEEVWNQIESFAGYAFAKGHSASYAVESYQSLFLKTYYPLEFIVSVINNFGGFYSSELYIKEAKKLGGIIELPCINNSNELTKLDGNTVWLGLGLVQSLESNTIYNILNERRLGGLFTSIDNFTDRGTIDHEQVKILINTGAFRNISESKKSAMWKMHISKNRGKEAKHNKLFYSEIKLSDIPKFEDSITDDIFDEIEFLGFTVKSYYTILKNRPHNMLQAKDLIRMGNKNVIIYGELVAIKYTKTKNRDIMYFGTFLDINGDFIDTVHFPDSAKLYPFSGKGVYKINGKVIIEYGHVSIEVKKIEHQQIIEDTRYS
jgi:DNA polymerase-3 subunit alpha